MSTTPTSYMDFASTTGPLLIFLAAIGYRLAAATAMRCKLLSSDTASLHTSADADADADALALGHLLCCSRCRVACACFSTELRRDRDALRPLLCATSSHRRVLRLLLATGR